MTRPWSKTDAEREEMLLLHRAGEKLAVIAYEFDVTDAYVSILAKRRGEPPRRTISASISAATTV